MAEQLRQRLKSAILNEVMKNDQVTWCLLFSGGVDTCAILHILDEIKIKVDLITVVTDVDAPDLVYAKHYAQKFKDLIRFHHIEIVSCDALLKNETENVIKALRSFDPMQIRNSLVINCAISIGKSIFGSSHFLCGDGADELFGGYSFTWETPDPEWTKSRNDMCKMWYFAGSDLAKALNVDLFSPFLDEDFVRWSLETTAKEDCVGYRDIELLPNTGGINHITGKLCLRDAFKLYRRKDPIEIGSGATRLSRKEFWLEYAITDEKEYYHQIFQKHFKSFNDSTTTTTTTTTRCSKCEFPVFHPNYCKTCGAYPVEFLLI